MPASGAPIGTPFGSGTPATASAPPLPPAALSRYINPGSKDYEIDPVTKQFKKMPPVRQRMLLIMATNRGSSSVLPNLGIRRPKKIDQTFDRRMRNEIRAAYRQLTDVEKVARIDDILIDPRSGGRPIITIVYTDLTTLTEDQRITGVL